MATRHSQFAPTRWTLVLDASKPGDSEPAQRALAELCQLYWQPLYAYVRRCGHDPHTAEDLTQEFFARLLAKNTLASVAPSKGKFRSFLLMALKRFLANEWDRVRAQKRGGGHAPVSLEAIEVRDELTPEQSFDRQWALTALARVMTRLEAQYAGEKAALFAALKPGLTGESRGHAELAGQLGLREGAVRVAAHRLRERFGKLLREEVAQTVASPGEVEEELRYLLSFL